MTANQVITDTVRIEINYAMQNNNAANVLHAHYTGTVGYAELDALELVIAGWLTSDWAPLASDMWEATSIDLIDMGSLTGVRKSYPLSPPTQGTNVSQALPANATLAIKADIGRRGRGVNGRTFWVGLAEDGVQGNEVLTTISDDIISAMQTLNTNVITTGTYDGLCIPNMGWPGHTHNPAACNLVASYLVTNNLIDSQKDRLPFHKKKKKRLPVVP
jgi:hypothetical protein